MNDNNVDDEYYKQTIRIYVNLTREIVDKFNPEKRVLPIMEKLPENIQDEFEHEYNELVHDWKNYKDQIESRIKEIQQD